jgi:Tfp pilus assembly protein PilF
MRWSAVAVAAVVLIPSVLKAQGKIDIPVPMTELVRRVKADSNDPAAHYNVALAYWNAKKWDDVTRELGTAVQLDPRFAAAHLALAYLPFAREPRLLEGISRIDAGTPKHIRDALDQRTREFRHAFLIDPMVDMRIMAATDVSMDYWAMHDALNGIDAALIQGLTDCEEGRYASCENNLAIFMKDYGNSRKIQSLIPADVLWYHGIAAAHQAHYDTAIADFRQLINRDSVAVKKAEEKELVHFPIRTNEYRYFIGVFQQAGGHPADAIATLDDALEHDLSLYIAHVRLAEVYEARKDFDHAIAERRDAVNANPDDASLEIDLGVTLGRAGKFAEAQTALKTATDALPRSVDAWFWLGIADEQLGQKDDARTAFQRVVKIAPSRMQSRVTQAEQHLGRLS